MATGRGVGSIAVNLLYSSSGQQATVDAAILLPISFLFCIVRSWLRWTRLMKLLSTHVTRSQATDFFFLTKRNLGWLWPLVTISRLLLWALHRLGLERDDELRTCFYSLGFSAEWRLLEGPLGREDVNSSRTTGTQSGYMIGWYDGLK